MLRTRLVMLLAVTMMVVATFAFAGVATAAGCGFSCTKGGPDCAKFIGKAHGPKACGF